MATDRYDTPEEGTSGAQVFEKVRRAPDDELAKVTKETRKAIRKEISGADFVRFVQMLDDRLLTWDERNFKTTEQHYELAINCGNLAAILHRRGELDAAEVLYRRALSIKETVLGPDHPELATTLNNLGVLCRAQERYAEAKTLHRRALTLLEAAVEPTHPTLTACRENYDALLRRAEPSGGTPAASPGLASA